MQDAGQFVQSAETAPTLHARLAVRICTAGAQPSLVQTISATSAVLCVLDCFEQSQWSSLLVSAKGLANSFALHRIRFA